MTTLPKQGQREDASSVILTTSQWEALVALSDTMIPSLDVPGEQSEYWRLNASSLQVPQRITEALTLLNDQERNDFLQLLTMFASPWTSLLFAGQFKPFAQLDAEHREKWLQKWANSSLQLFRKAIASLHKLTAFIFFADTTAQFPNPTWKHIGYPGPLTPAPKREKPIKPIVVDRDITLRCDVVVVGSGAGGGVVIGELAKAGKDVIVVEKGGYFNEADFDQLEAKAVATMYEKGGTLANASGSMTIFAGSALGGGTVINWAGTLRTPDYILHEWATEHHSPQFESAEYAHSLDAAAKALDANTHFVKKNKQNLNLFNGSQKQGHLVKDIPQNIVNLADFDQRLHGYSCFGDQFSTKRSKLVSHLEEAARHQVRFLVKTEVEKVLIRNGQAVGVEAIHRIGGKVYRVTVHADRVVVAAGAVHTPALLIRSGLRHPHIGRHLNLHPVVCVTGIYQEPVNCWWGGMMTVTNDQFTRLDGNYGFKLETPPAHSGLIGMSLPWVSGRRNKELMLKAAHLSNIIILTRDKYSGRVKTDAKGKPVVDYHLHPYDLAHLQRGMAECLAIHREAGAKEMLVPHRQLPILEAQKPFDGRAVVQGLRWKPNDFMLFSAHQMSSCRMGGTSKDHPVAPNGETYEVKNLFVADASAFPSCSGANPMLSVEALAHFIAKGLQ